MDWQQGQRVAVYRCGAGSDHVTLATVERVTATQVVLAGGGKFRRDNGREVGESARRGAWDAWRELRPVDDPKVRAVQARQVVSRLVDRIADKRRDLHGEGAALALLGFIERETAAVRVTVEKLIREE